MSDTFDIFRREMGIQMLHPIKLAVNCKGAQAAVFRLELRDVSRDFPKTVPPKQLDAH